ncbi:hypothetical protein Tco_0606394 [Tanacetum coccineum]
MSCVIFGPVTEDKDSYYADTWETNILLQEVTHKTFTISSSHYTEAKDIWDNMKMLLEGSELTKEDRESQLFEASMERAQRDEFLAEKDKSRKRRRDDQDPPPPPPDSDLVKRTEMTLALWSSQPMLPQSSALEEWTLNSAHLPKTKQRPEWLKPIPDDERPATPKPAWVIPTSHIPDAMNNWANALATTYQAPADISLLEKTWDMQTFMN